MAWTATVINKAFNNGIYTVTVRYTDGTKTVDETYRTTVPIADWIPRQVALRLPQLEIAGAFDISEAPVTPYTPPAVDPNIELFRERCRILETVKILIDLGAVQVDNSKVRCKGKPSGPAFSIV